jgi:predicted ATPase/transcriptional regulator with XRE-family HTH domain
MESIDPPVYFGEWLKRRRKALDLTQAELAERAGYSVPAIRKIESGERRPSKQLASLLASSLEIPAADQDTFVRVARGELNLERLSQLSLGTAPGYAPPPKPTPPSINLPTAPTPLVGRQPELTALGQLLHDPQCRLLTITGTGGIGKTRLAIEAARSNQDIFADGACFVPLAPLSSPAFIVPTIADALNFNFQGHIEPRIQLLNYLRAKRMLLVLDNVEHLLDGVDLFTEILQHAPAVKVLVTSRERLNLRGEWVFEIQGLPVPPTDQITDVEEYSSVALFMHSARRAQTGFELANEEISHVVHICQIVEGMPLGIELAAAWVHALTCREIAREIERSMDFLATSMRDVPNRQRSLRATFDHSWSLLPTNERQVLCRLAVFQGGFEREAAEQVTDATLQSLSALVSKSLVRHAESGRYDLHEVVHQYAQSHFADDPQADMIHHRHCEFYLTLLRNRENDLKGSDQRKAFRELTNEIDNLRAAWFWGIKSRKFALIGSASRSFGRLFEIGGWHRAGIDTFEPVVRASKGVSGDVESQKALGIALAQQALLSFRRGRFDKAQELYRDSLDVLRPFGDPCLLHDQLVIWGIIKHLNGEIERAKSLIDEGLVCAQAAGDQWSTAYALYNQGYIASLLGHYRQGNELMQSGLSMWRELGDPQYTALGLNFITPTLIQLGRHEEAIANLQESLSLCEQVGDRWGKGTAYRFLGSVDLALGNIDEAQSNIRKSLDLFNEFTTGWDIIQSLVFLGDAAAAGGDSATARRIYLDTLPMAMEHRIIPLVLDVLLGMTGLLVQDGELQRALGISIFILNHNASTQITKDLASQLAAEMEMQLKIPQLEEAREWCKAQTLEMIVDELLLQELD